MAGESSYNVKLYIYDLSKGMARQLSLMMLGKHLEGIWHTSIVAFGEEFFFGGVGISSCPPGGTLLGMPDSIVDLGNTEVPRDLFLEYLSSLSGSYSPEQYHIFEHNCNNFSCEVAQFLTGSKIPSYITDLPSEVLSTPFGQALRPFLDSITITPPGSRNLNGFGQRSGNKPHGDEERVKRHKSHKWILWLLHASSSHVSSENIFKVYLLYINKDN